MDYKQAGVDIDAGNRLVSRISPMAKSTHNPNVLNNIGGFGSMYRLPAGYKSPVLVSGTDGVGTKLLLAIEEQELSGVGIDLVAMCVNDIIVQGAKPLYFLDYLATGKLKVDEMEEVVKGITVGCHMADISLVGGESAEMPGMYNDGHFDLAGFCVGVVEEEDIITGENILAGDTLIGIESSGIHSNGFSLIRKIIEVNRFKLHDTQFITQLLEPTRIYVRPIMELIGQVSVLGMAHITGGGLTENIPRMLPKGRTHKLHLDSWTMPQIFMDIKHYGNVSKRDMMLTFNCGIGMVICVPDNEKHKALELLTIMGEKSHIIGNVI